MYVAFCQRTISNISNHNFVIISDSERDILNERPLKEDLLSSKSKVSQNSESTQSLKDSKYALLHTSAGEIKIELFPSIAPKAVENFATLAKQGYYDKVIFHRVIKGFMIQTGDPLGKASITSVLSRIYNHYHERSIVDVSISIH